MKKNFKKGKRGKAKPKKLPKVIKHEEALILFSKAKTTRDKMLLEAMYFCGLRVSETISIKYGHIDQKDWFLKVVQGKGSKDRLVPIPKPLQRDLKMWFSLKQFDQEDYLFEHPYNKKPLTRERVHQIVKNIDKKIHCHTLRHSYATYVFEKTGNIKLVQDLLGHSNAKTTMIYTHLSRGHKRATVDKVFE